MLYFPLTLNRKEERVLMKKFKLDDIHKFVSIVLMLLTIITLLVNLFS